MYTTQEPWFYRWQANTTTITKPTETTTRTEERSLSSLAEESQPLQSCPYLKNRNLKKFFNFYLDIKFFFPILGDYFEKCVGIFLETWNIWINIQAFLISIIKSIYTYSTCVYHKINHITDKLCL